MQDTQSNHSTCFNLGGFDVSTFGFSQKSLSNKSVRQKIHTTSALMPRITQCLHRIAIVIAMLGMIGCSTLSEKYYWNSYENLIYDMYNKPGKVTPTVQIEKLSTDIQRAASLGKPIPPGVYAHLGLMHASNGNTQRAEAAFNKEIEHYPESKTMLEGMMRRATSQQP